MEPIALPGPFWLVGCGNMGSAMLEGWLAAGLDPARITVIRPSGTPIAPGVRVLTAVPEGEVPAVVLLGVKPQKLGEVAPGLAPLFGPDTILISILAGAEQASLRALFPTPRTIVRAMPNLPVRLRKGAIGLYTDSASREDAALAGALMAMLGEVAWLEEEALFDLVTALSGSGPAFLFRFIDALAAAGAELGLPPYLSARLALATVAGAGAMAVGAGESPAALADRVASPGGSTRKGLDVLDEGDRLKLLLRDTLDASLRRNREMAAETRHLPPSLG